jgi:hypothetical protein
MEMTNETLMRQHFILWWVGVLSIAVYGTCAHAQEVTLTDGRPIATAIETLSLEHLYGVPITYEDTLYMNDNDIADITEAVRADHDGSNLNRVLVPVERTITFTLPEPQPSETVRSQSERAEAALAAVKSVLDSYTFSGGAGSFTVSEDSFGLHIISRAFTDASGKSQILKPALETQISITHRLKPALTLINEICKQLSTADGGVVELGAVPMKLLASHLVNVDVTNGAARDILESISKQIEVPLSWELFCDHDRCALNIHVVE